MKNISGFWISIIGVFILLLTITNGIFVVTDIFDKTIIFAGIQLEGSHCIILMEIIGFIFSALITSIYALVLLIINPYWIDERPLKNLIKCNIEDDEIEDDEYNQYYDLYKKVIDNLIEEYEENNTR